MCVCVCVCVCVPHLLDMHQLVYEQDDGFLLRLRNTHLRVAVHLRLEVRLHERLVVPGEDNGRTRVELRAGRRWKEGRKKE